MTYYYTDQNRQPQGPVSIEELRSMLEAGTVNSATLVAFVGSQKWQPINEILNNLPPEINPSIALDSPTTPAKTPSGNEPLALWGFILSLLGITCCGFFTSVPGVICGHIALSRIKKDPAIQGKGFAVAAVIIGYAGLVIWFAYLIAFGLPNVLESTN